MPETRRRFDPGFGAGAVRIVVETGKPIARVARDVGIRAGTLGDWVDAERRDGGEGALGLSESWFCRWRNGPPSGIEARRAGLDAGVKDCFDGSDGTYGSARIGVQLRRAGRAVSPKSVEASMARQGLAARPNKRRRRRSGDGEAAPEDLIGRDFTAPAPDQRWVGDFAEIPTPEGKAHLATVIDLCSRRVVGFAASNSHPTAKLAQAAVETAAATRGGDAAGVIFHTDKGTQYTAGDFARACEKLDITRSTGRVGCALDNAAAESLVSTLTWELIRRRDWQTRRQARRDTARRTTDRHNTRRPHSTPDTTSPTDYEQANTD